MNLLAEALARLVKLGNNLYTLRNNIKNYFFKTNITHNFIINLLNLQKNKNILIKNSKLFIFKLIVKINMNITQAEI